MATINLTNRADRFTDSDLGNRIFGRGGNDVIFGRGGEDYIDGGDGNDTLYSGNNPLPHSYAETIIGGAGNDVIFGGVGFQNLYGGSANDQIDASTLDSSSKYEVGDYVVGGRGDDDLIGNTFDTLIGSEGNDRLYLREDVGYTISAGAFINYSNLYGESGADRFVVDFVADGSGETVTAWDFRAGQGDKLFLRILAEDGTVLMRDAEIKHALDTNDDQRLDANDSYDAATDFGVEVNVYGLQLHLGGGDVAEIFGRSAYDFVV